MEKEKIKNWLYRHVKEDTAEGSFQSFSDQELEEFTEDFLKDLKWLFESYIEGFNEIKDESQTLPEVSSKLQLSLYVYDLADQKGFLIFRPGYRLIFSTPSPGRVRVQFLKSSGPASSEALEDSLIKAISTQSLSLNWAHENFKGFLDKNLLVRYYIKKILED